MDSLYSRYSFALLSIAKDEKKVKEYKEAINVLLKYFLNHDEVNTYLKSYFVKEKEKEKVIDEMCEPFKLNNLSSFIKLLVKKHRFIDFKHIAEEFTRDCNEAIGISEGTVYSTVKLDEFQIAKIEVSISKKLNCKVELKNEIDERLIGGVKVVVHDHVYDGSIKNKIETMKTKLDERRNEQ